MMNDIFFTAAVGFALCFGFMCGMDREQAAREELLEYRIAPR